LHGALAHAGKVRNQTPKVEKAEKKKKATGTIRLEWIDPNHTYTLGRAKKRHQYNRRFVTAAVGFGGKRVGVYIQ
jgi:small subunit ribosomal protein S30e